MQLVPESLRRVLRRKLAAAETIHKGRKTSTTFRQRPLAVSRVMQAFRDVAVRERLLRDEGRSLAALAAA